MTAGGSAVRAARTDPRRGASGRRLPRRPRVGVGGGRGRLREPLRQQRLRRPRLTGRVRMTVAAARSPTASGPSRWGAGYERPPTCCSRTSRSTASAWAAVAQAPGSAGRAAMLFSARGSARWSSTPRCPATRRRSATRATPARSSCFTYPLIGNYGVAADQHGVRPRPRARGGSCARGSTARTPPTARRRLRLTWLARLRHPGADRRRHARTGAAHPRQGSDARRRLRRVRSGRAEARERVARQAGAWPAQDLAHAVTPGRAARGWTADGRLASSGSTPASRPSISRQPPRGGARSWTRRCSMSTDELPRARRTRSFSPTAPGDPAALDYVVETVRGLVGKVPVWGICLGHQLLCRAVGFDLRAPFRPPRGEPPRQGPRDRPARPNASAPRSSQPRKPAGLGSMAWARPIRSG